ncbi:OsmC family protein [Sphingomonas astaxanthinifaciens]|uniref:Peroxiredoxin n=1 Tax=Sphingomonas astaxanthinifaciens DSM 22298 TaxID=1123267 RepID=A0ABQ5Z6C9_9SPHN|nr:OsmC family protein [Sphingomonas astaxanthinifaciens]GLR48328.1 peroxiredoxin [Sphingomonas astaxanthinifaciens DSM 22298]
MITRTATARYEGLGKTGKGWISTQSKVLDQSRYGFNTRFEGEPGTNPEELIAAAHAGCFTMALSFGLANAGATEGSLETEARVKLDQDGAGFKISRSDLRLVASVPGIEESELRRLAEEAKANCPISKALNVEMTLEVEVRAPADA